MMMRSMCMTPLVSLWLLAVLLGQTTAEGTEPADLPQLVRSIVPATFTYNTELTRLLNDAGAQLLANMPEEMQTAPLQQRWWAFSVAATVDEAYGVLDIPSDAVQIPPNTVPLADVLNSYLDFWGDVPAATWGAGWRTTVDERVQAWAEREHRQATVMLWHPGDVMAVEDDPTELVSMQVMLGGRNVSKWSAAAVMSPGEVGQFVAALLPGPDGERLVGRLLPGTYEVFVVHEHEGTKGFTMEPVRLIVASGREATVVANLEVWDLPVAMPWTLDTFADAQAIVTAIETDTVANSYLFMDVVNPYLNPIDLNLVEGTHLLVLCIVEGEWGLLRATTD